MFFLCAAAAVFAIIFFVTSRFWNKKKRNIKGLIGGILCVLLFMYELISHVSVITNPDIVTHEGKLIQVRRGGVVLFGEEYVLENGNDRNEVFYLDTFTKKKIYADDFEEGEIYRIQYEKKTKIIVKVDRVS